VEEGNRVTDVIKPLEEGLGSVEGNKVVADDKGGVTETDVEKLEDEVKLKEKENRRGCRYRN